MPDWPLLAIGKLFDVELGRMLAPGSEHGTQWPYLANRNVQWGRLVLNDLGTMHFSEPERNRYALQRGDVLVCEGGEIGRTAVWNEEIDRCYFQNAIHRLRPGGQIDSQYMRHFMEYAAARGWLRGLSGQTSIAHLPKERLVAWEIPVPPLEEQRRIAKILDTVDEAIQATERLIAKLSKVQIGTARDLLLGHSSDPGWQRTRLSDVAKISTGTTPSRERGDYWAQGTIPWVKTAEVGGAPITETEERITSRAVAECSLRILPVGTVLVAMYGQGRTRGRSAILGIEATTNQACAAIETSPRLDAVFLFELLQAEYERVRSAGHGSHQLNLSAAILGAFTITVPSPEEQERCVRVLSTFRDRVVAEVRTLAALRSLQRGLANDLLVGRVRTVTS